MVFAEYAVVKDTKGQCQIVKAQKAIANFVAGPYKTREQTVKAVKACTVVYYPIVTAIEKHPMVFSQSKPETAKMLPKSLWPKLPGVKENKK